MVMMNDEQRASDVLASAGGPTATNRAEGPAAEKVETEGAEPAEPDDDGAAEEPKSRWSFLTEMVVLFAVALTIALLIKTFVVQPFYIPSSSMEDTLLVGDKVLVNKVMYRIRPIDRGDVVVFNGAGSWLPPTASPPSSHNPVARLYDATLGQLFASIRGLLGTEPGQTDYIKRVIGVPGDHVACCNAKGQITVNGVALHESSYLIPGARPSQGAFRVVVPPGRLWVMGDNRPQSAESRYHECGYTYAPPQCVPYDKGGTIPEGRVIGRAFMVVWPLSRIRMLPIPSTFSQGGLSHVSASRAGPVEPDLTTGVPVRPSAPYLPLAGGLACAASAAGRGGGNRHAPVSGTGSQNPGGERPRSCRSTPCPRSCRSQAGRARLRRRRSRRPGSRAPAGRLHAAARRRAGRL